MQPEQVIPQCTSFLSAVASRTDFFSQPLRLRRSHDLLSEPAHVLNCMLGDRYKLGQSWENWKCTLIVTHIVQNISPINLTWSSTPRMPTYVHVSLCPPGLQSADPHTRILSDKCCFPFLNSPETWLFLWQLFFLHLSQVETISDSHSLCISEREDET